MEAVVHEASCEPKLILFIDEIHLLLGAGSASGSRAVANILKPALARGAIRVVDRLLGTLFAEALLSGKLPAGQAIRMVAEGARLGF